MRGTTAKLLRKFTRFHPAEQRNYEQKVTQKLAAVPKEVSPSGYKLVPRITLFVSPKQARSIYGEAKKHYRRDPKMFQTRIFPVISQ